MIYYQNIKIDSKTLKFYKKLNLQVPATLNRLLKKSFFSQTRSWANKRKYHPQASLKQTGLFLKNNKPKPLMA